MGAVRLVATRLLFGAAMAGTGAFIPSSGFVPGPPKLTPRQQQGPQDSNFGVLGDGKCVFHVGTEVADRVLDFAMTKKYPDSMQVSCRPVDE